MNELSTDSGTKIIRHSEQRPAVPADFLSDSQKIVLLVHGFTANGSYLYNLADYLDSSGEVRCLIANYDSLGGTERSAQGILALLLSIEERIVDRSKDAPWISLVGHSFGGIVCTYMMKRLGGKRFFDKLVTLGTPHGGVLGDKSYIASFTRFMQKLTNEPFFVPALGSKATSELTLSDKQNMLKQLARKESEFPVSSISAGQPFIKLGKNRVTNIFTNRTLQHLLQEKPNDGLVVESSSDARQHFNSRATTKAQHLNSYPDFSKINHSEIVNSQYVAGKILSLIT